MDGMGTRRVGSLALAILEVAAVLCACSPGNDEPRSPRSSELLTSMEALGASTTRGYNTDCPAPWTDCPDNSWSTGTNPAVGSIYLRLLSRNPRLRNHNYNDALSGSAMADLSEQAQNAVRRRVALVTIAMAPTTRAGLKTVP